jgi:phosphopantothenoylcysteine decarboxylase/phosphopantothenate--cysteine ligase
MQKTVLITTGPTREFIDPVRFISNLSSGKLGYHIAKQFIKNKYKTILVSGPTCIKYPKSWNVYYVQTTQEMFDVVKKFLSKVDIFIFVAAVADFKPEKIFVHKVKKKEKIVLSLIPTIDILEYVGKNKNPSQLVVGFALETDKKNAVKYAKEKLCKKNLDLIVLNSEETFGSDFIKPTIIYSNGKIQKLKKMTKEKFAKILFCLTKKLIKEKSYE